MLGAVCHDFGKPATTAFIDGRIRSMDHEEQGVAPAAAFLDRLNVTSIDGYDVRRQSLGSRAASEAGLVVQSARRSRRRRVPPARAQGRPRASGARRKGGLRRPPSRPFDCSAMDWFLERARALGVEHRPPAPILLGRHLLELGMNPGPRVGEILKAVYEKQMDGSVTTLEQAIGEAKRLL
jgi:tRNA nucleotidyltransferase (CCA-adding enzyme)